jgi:hypothetical protein
MQDKDGQPIFDHRELATILIKHANIHEGLWGIAIEFGLFAANINTPTDLKTLTPAAMALVQRVGLQPFETANNLTVDAALVNPRPKGKKKP